MPRRKEPTPRVNGRYNVVPYDETVRPNPGQPRYTYRPPAAEGVTAKEALRVTSRVLSKPGTMYDDLPMKALIVPVGAYGELQMVAAATCRRGGAGRSPAASARMYAKIQRGGRAAVRCELAPYFKRDAMGDRKPRPRKRRK